MRRRPPRSTQGRSSAASDVYKRQESGYRVDKGIEIYVFENPQQDSLSVKITNSLDQTCLLYTSPSPRDRTRSRMPSSA